MGGLLAAGLLAQAAVMRVDAAPLPVPGTGLVVKDSQPDFAWDPACPKGDSSGCYVSRAVQFPSRRSGAVLVGTLYGPGDIDALGRVPAVVVIPPSGGAATQGSVSYLAKFLAVRDGFIGLTVDPQGVGDSGTFGDPPCGAGSGGRTNPSPCPNVPYQQMDNFFDAGQSALDFLEGHSDPWAEHIQPAWVGATGHSEGARAAAYLQDPAFDGRAHAVVALDNLTTEYCGDAGTPSNEGPGGQTGLQNAAINGEPYCVTDPADPSSIGQPGSDPRFQVHPTAPAMGLASDGPGGLGANYPAADPAPAATEGPPTEKETAYLAWKRDGLPTAELVLAGVNHNQFAQSSTSADTLLHRIAVYTAAWFDLWLGHNPGAASTITSCATPGEPMSSFLSASYLSSVYLPPGDGLGRGVEIDDLRKACP